MQYQKMAAALAATEQLLITGHLDPDCDCAGSMLALYQGLRGEEKDWRLVLADQLPENLRFLPGLERIITPAELDIEPSAILFIDCDGPVRAGEAWLAPYLEAGVPCYCIDHHQSNSFTGELALVDVKAAAAAEIVYFLLEKAGCRFLPEMALNLYSGIVSDTGCFRYSNTTPASLRIAAKLLELGVDTELVRQQLFESRSYANMRMLAVAFNNMAQTAGGLLCYTFIDQASMAKYQATAEDCHNIINFTLGLAGVKIGILFEEYDSFVKISLRARPGFRVDELAKQLGGGGHQAAAGCRIMGPLDEVMPQVLRAAKQLLPPPLDPDPA